MNLLAVFLLWVWKQKIRNFLNIWQIKYVKVQRKFASTSHQRKIIECNSCFISVVFRFWLFLVAEACSGLPSHLSWSRCGNALRSLWGSNGVLVNNSPTWVFISAWVWKTRICCTYPNLESWEGRWRRQWCMSQAANLHAFFKQKYFAERGVARCVLSKNNASYVSSPQIWRSLVKLTPMWVSWESRTFSPSVFLLPSPPNIHDQSKGALVVLFRFLFHSSGSYCNAANAWVNAFMTLSEHRLINWRLKIVMKHRISPTSSRIYVFRCLFMHIFSADMGPHMQFVAADDCAFSFDFTMLDNVFQPTQGSSVLKSIAAAAVIFLYFLSFYMSSERTLNWVFMKRSNVNVVFGSRGGYIT